MNACAYLTADKHLPYGVQAKSHEADAHRQLFPPPLALLSFATTSFVPVVEQCLCLLTEDIMSVDVAGLNDGDGGDHDHLSSQFIPGDLFDGRLVT